MRSALGLSVQYSIWEIQREKGTKVKNVKKEEQGWNLRVRRVD